MKNKKIILVKAAPRCGSNLVIQHFVQAGYYRKDAPRYFGEIDSNKIYLEQAASWNNKLVKKAVNNNIVIHDHSINYLLPDKFLYESMIIHVKRFNEFDQIMSQAVIYRLQQEKSVIKLVKKKNLDLFYPQTDFTKYLPQIILEKYFFEILVEEFYHIKKETENIILQSGFEYHTVYFEDFVVNRDYLKKFTPETLKYDRIDDFQKTKIRAKNIFINYDEICQWWQDIKNKYS